MVIDAVKTGAATETDEGRGSMPAEEGDGRRCIIRRGLRCA